MKQYYFSISADSKFYPEFNLSVSRSSLDNASFIDASKLGSFVLIKKGTVITTSDKKTIEILDKMMLTRAEDGIIIEVNKVLSQSEANEATFFDYDAISESARIRESSKKGN